jgi:hypothetical protein
MPTNYRADHLDRQAIARAILTLVLATRNQKNSESKGAMEQYAPRVISWTCRELHQFGDFISQAAKEKAEKELGMTIAEVFAMGWHEQPFRDPGREKLRFEHMFPIGHAVSEIMAMSNPTVEAIESILAKIAVCWVTAEEDKKLGRRYRPDHRQAYANAGIVVLDRTGRRVDTSSVTLIQ